jgi:hypothetical protein
VAIGKGIEVREQNREFPFFTKSKFQYVFGKHLQTETLESVILRGDYNFLGCNTVSLVTYRPKFRKVVAIYFTK